MVAVCFRESTQFRSWSNLSNSDNGLQACLKLTKDEHLNPDQVFFLLLLPMTSDFLGRFQTGFWSVAVGITLFVLLFRPVLLNLICHQCDAIPEVFVGDLITPYCQARSGTPGFLRVCVCRHVETFSTVRKSYSICYVVSSKVSLLSQCACMNLVGGDSGFFVYCAAYCAMQTCQRNIEHPFFTPINPIQHSTCRSEAVAGFLLAQTVDSYDLSVTIILGDDTE